MFMQSCLSQEMEELYPSCQVAQSIVFEFSLLGIEYAKLLVFSEYTTTLNQYFLEPLLPAMVPL